MCLDLGDLGGGASIATAINARGQVTGISLREDGSQAGFIWQNGVMTDLGSLGGSYEQSREAAIAGGLR